MSTAPDPARVSRLKSFERSFSSRVASSSSAPELPESSLLPATTEAAHFPPVSKASSPKKSPSLYAITFPTPSTKASQTPLRTMYLHVAGCRMQNEHAHTCNHGQKPFVDIPPEIGGGSRVPGTHIASADSPCEMMRPFGSNETSSSTSDNLFRSYSDKLLQSGTLHIRTQDDRQWTEPRTAQCGHRQCAGRHNECNNNFCAGVRIQEAFVVFALMIA